MPLSLILWIKEIAIIKLRNFILIINELIDLFIAFVVIIIANTDSVVILNKSLVNTFIQVSFVRFAVDFFFYY